MNLMLATASMTLAALGLFAIAFTYRQLFRFLVKQRQEVVGTFDNCYRQIETLMALHVALDSPRGLPPLRGWACSPDFLLNVCRFALDNRTRVVVECGSGASTVALARCMQLLGEGHVYSFEHDPTFAESTRALLRRNDLEPFATVLELPLRHLELQNWSGDWYSCDAIPIDVSIDLLLVDGPPHTFGRLARYPALPVLFERLTTGAAVFIDDADREGERECIKRWLGEFADLRSEDVPVCEKGCVLLRRQ